MPVLTGDNLVAVTELGDMYVLKAENGMSERTISVGYAVMAPLYADGEVVYVHARDHYVYAVDIQSGEIIWKFTSDVE